MGDGWPTVLNCVEQRSLYGAGVYLSHPRRYTLVMLYTKAQTPLVRFVVDLLPICKTCGQQIEPLEFELHRACTCLKPAVVGLCSKCCQYRRSLCVSPVGTLDVQLSHCVQRDMVNWA